MNYDSFKKYIAKFPGKKVLVIGDVMLDEYIDGDTERISPEAPIPVLLQRSVHHVLGGAGNVVANVAALGGTVTLIGVVGKDLHANILKRLLRSSRITSHLQVDTKRPTTSKLRFISGHHQLVRIDIEEKKPISGVIERGVIRAIRSLPSHDIVIISDYAKGCITEPVLSAIRRRFGPNRIIADMKPENSSLYKGIFAITPNIKEGADITSVRATTDALAERVVKILAKRLNTSVILTRGEHGVTALEQGARKSFHFQSDVLTIKDVTGAGDTLVAALALMHASGAPFLMVAELANYAAGLVVGYGGTYTLSRVTLEESLKKRPESAKE
jgi:rfaE bifunctional protein kinase chain/domain